jgi:adenine-specific DNA-methyltransferase
MENINDFMPQSTDWNKERLDTLKQLMPDIFTNEGKLNIDELKKIIDPLSIQELERFEFRWFGKSQAKRTAFAPSNATLRLDESRSINPETTQNIIIEGENLEVLKLLSGAYREKIKCIYIDPPYNTGKDFVYSDVFKQDKKSYWEDAEITENGVRIDSNNESDGRYHSNWLNMMYSRLLIARQLLKQDGVIFISIDDNEVHHLRKLGDEVFGEENFIGELIWKSRQNKDNRTNTGVSTDHEYVICYSKNFEQRALRGAERKIEQYSNPDNDERGDWVSANMVGLKDEMSRPNLHYNLIDSETGINYGKPKMGWRYDKTTMKKLIDEKRIIWPVSSEGRPRRKVFLNDLNENLPGFSSFVGEDIFTRNGTIEIENLFGERLFDFPKPSTFIAEIIDQVVENQDIILDFFAGSGSTGQAVLDLNQQNGRIIKYILVQIPEATDDKSEAYKSGYKKISDITIERNKRVIENILMERKAYEAQIFELQQLIETHQKEIKNEKAAKPTLALGDAADSKAVQVLKTKIEKNEETIAELRDKIVKIDALDKGFKVFQLVKSSFPRVEFAPDVDKTDAENIELLKAYILEKETQLYIGFEHKELMGEILLKRGFSLNYQLEKQGQFDKNAVYLASDGEKELLVCLDIQIEEATIAAFKTQTDVRFLCLERAVDTTKKWNLKHALGDKFIAF